MTFLRRFLRLALACAALAAGAAQAAIPASQRQYLLDFYAATDGLNWHNNTGWDGPVGTECAWQGVRCDADKTTVIRLALIDNNLVGTIPDWSTLPDLEEILLGVNALTGPVPSISGLPNLTVFSVPVNQLSGALPSPAHLTKLQHYGAYNNQFTGSIPALTNVPVLETLVAGGNQLSGSIPALAGTNLLLIELLDNQLTGVIPALPASLLILRVEDNRLSGPVPVAPAGLQAGMSVLCPNNLTPSANAAWDAASPAAPWHMGCSALSPGPGAGAAAIPTLGEWTLLLLSLLAAATGLVALRRNQGA